MRYPITCKSNLEVFKREPSRVSSVGFLTLGDALSVAGVDCMRAHHEKITTRFSNQLLTTHPTRLMVCYQKSAAGQLILFKETGDSVVDLHKTKTKGFADTYINKSSSVDIYSWLAVYMYILRLVTCMYYILAYYIFRFVKLCNSVYYNK